VDTAGGFVAMGSLGIGLIPQEGEGYRMMWHPYRAAFRAGGVNSDQWNDANVGFFSAAFGQNTQAEGNWSIAAGHSAFTDQPYSVSMGFATHANGQAAIALGYRATANANYGAIVISDGSSADSLQASADHQFNLRASGGIRLYTNATRTSGVTMNAGAATWNTVSDRNRKDLFLAVDGEDVLARIRSLPVTTWRYITEEDRTVRHIGPMAQDWHRAFGFSPDSLTINQGDFDGVNLAGIQALDTRTERQQAELAALHQQVQALEAQNQALRTENTEARRRADELENRMLRLEAALAPAQR
jgi:outer membrane murein-binding lipoprotein Lpp